ncbi:hypothetical protein, partial [Bradyrhizobium sp. CW11]|uniref:hypothetical protein n=1 Tax=Bradyrhizobium sp. CW11 TaxID=2782684 RepID=UPI001FF76DCF
YHRPAALQLPQNRRCLNGSDAALDTKAIRQKRERHRAEKIALTVDPAQSCAPAEPAQNRRRRSR